jgi:hypothetical protein
MEKRMTPEITVRVIRMAAERRVIFTKCWEAAGRIPAPFMR